MCDFKQSVSWAYSKYISSIWLPSYFGVYNSPHLCIGIGHHIRISIIMTGLRIFTKQSVWCSDNNLDRHIRKCQFIRFSIKFHPMKFEYGISDEALTAVNEVWDLVAFIDSKLKRTIITWTASLTRRIENWNFSCVYRWTLTNTACMKHLFSTLVRLSLEYLAPIWSDHLTQGAEPVHQSSSRDLLTLEQGLLPQP